MRIFLMALLAFLMLSTTAFAHPPVSITATAANDQVNITVVHPVQNILDHYIKRIEVKLNGQRIIEQNCTCQANNDDQKAVYIIPGLKKGDVLNINAECNQFGSLSKDVTI